MTGAVFLPCYYLGPNYGGGNEDNGNTFKRSQACTAALSTPNPAAGHHQPTLCQRLLDPHGQIWVSLLWAHCYFLLGPGVYNVLFVPA